MPLSKHFRFCLWWESFFNGGHFSTCQTRKKSTPVTFFLHMRHVFLRPGVISLRRKMTPRSIFDGGRYSSLHRPTMVQPHCWERVSTVRNFLISTLHIDQRRSQYLHKWSYDPIQSENRSEMVYKYDRRLCWHVYHSRRHCPLMRTDMPLLLQEMGNVTSAHLGWPNFLLKCVLGAV